MSLEETPKTRRLFFAFWPADGVRAAIARLARKKLHKNGKPVRPENLHVTVVFLGSVDEHQQRCLEAMAATLHGEPFELVLDRFGFWPKPRILWLAPAHMPGALLRLVAALNRGIQPCGFTPETRPYRPHVTLARKAAHGVDPWPPAAIPWPVTSFSLVESVTASEGAQYRVLRTWPL